MYGVLEKNNNDNNNGLTNPIRQPFYGIFQYGQFKR